MVFPQNAANAQESRITLSLNNEEHSIYNVILNSLMTNYVQSRKDTGEEVVDGIFLINENLDLTYDEAIKAAEYFKEKNAGVDEDLLQSFIENNTYHYAFDKTISFDSNFHWYNAFFNTAGIDNARPNFHKNGRLFPGHLVREALPHFVSIITFSRIGFNKQMNKAVLYFSWNDGLAYGDYIFLEKVNNEWRITGTLLSWIQ
jgi:hypothetical protein